MFQGKHQARKREARAGATSQHRNPCPSLFHHPVVLTPCLFIAQLIVWARDSAGSFCLLGKTGSTSCFGATCRKQLAVSLWHRSSPAFKLVFALLGAWLWPSLSPSPIPWHHLAVVWVQAGNRRRGFAAALGHMTFFPRALLPLN